ncbi:MAG: hypothetical protein K9M11_00515 [Candidatus Pacebacteria bacterium]|nr:hypothetical protein [Candidatus Paceibacterota bacterium]
MKNIVKITSKILSITPTALATMFAIALVFGLVGTTQVEAAAQSTYFVDITGNGCGNNCSDFYKYLTANGISVGTNNTNTSNYTNNGASTSNAGYSVPVGQNGKVPSSNYTQFPYQIYTPFASANTNYQPYVPVQYPEYIYIPYGKDATEQMNKYKKTYTSTASAGAYSPNSSASNGNSGFTITSILK